eukprot:TRINITY_DN2327_c0_g2_i1.p1 TRINITY_DN2327_c0_g2~~TRINITY_DN2327_c0_g2_i1.p1  ORF type:complete len:174 (+),score=43.85 TRINITY_DN2327_c0_g2_i1:1-522(+)
MAPAGMAPAGMAPAGMAPAGMAPAGMAPAGMAPAGMAPAPEGTAAMAPAPASATAPANGKAGTAKGKGAERLQQAADEVQSMVDRFEATMPALLTKMKYYLSNQFAMGILLKPVRDNVLEAYGETHKMLGVYAAAAANAGGTPDAAAEFMGRVAGPANLAEFVKDLVATHQSD